MQWIGSQAERNVIDTSVNGHFAPFHTVLPQP